MTASVSRMPRRQSVSSAARKGRLELLESLRDNIASQIDKGVPPRDLASLSRRLIDIAAQVDAIHAADKQDAVSSAATTPDAAWPV